MISFEGIRSYDSQAVVPGRAELRWNTNRGVMAFRGTDLNSSNPSGQVDACANAFLTFGFKT